MVLFFTILSLALSALHSTVAHFAFQLHNRGWQAYTITSHYMPLSLEKAILWSSLPMAIVSGVSVIFGTWVITELARKRISDDDFAGVLIKFYIFLDVLAFAEGMALAFTVHGHQASFQPFAIHDHIPYYEIMYYGGIATSAYGSVALIVLFLMNLWTVLASLCLGEIRPNNSEEIEMQLGI